MGSSRPEIQIVNVVATATLNQSLDLNAICVAFPAVKYHPEEFPGLVFRLKRPKTGILIFSSGRMVCTGARSRSQAKLAVRRVVEELRGKGIVILSKPETHIQNIVASVKLGGEVDVEKAVYALEKTIYEPEQFPAAIHRMEDPKVVFLINSNGSLVCLGAKNEKEIPRAVDKLKRRLEEAGVIYGKTETNGR